MRLFALLFASVTFAARPFLDEPDTGIDQALSGLENGTLPDLEDMVGLPDFQWAARRIMNVSSYTYYRNGAAGEWSYRNNLEVFQRFRLRPRVMVDITRIKSSFPTTILGYNFSAPFFISPCARGGYAHEKAEANLVRAAGAETILYIPSLYATLSIEDIANAKASPNQTTFQQIYLTGNDTSIKRLFRRIETAGSKAIVLTVDSPADGNRQRAARYGGTSEEPKYTHLTWDVYAKLKNMTSLPIVVKGIQTVDDAREAVRNGVPAIYLSNHGGRQLDTSPSSLEVALEIHEQDPDIFKQVEVYADGGVRYGADVVKLLALGVKAVGLGRPFMFSNVFGEEGVKRAIRLLKREVAIDAANLGVGDLKRVGPQYVDWRSVNAWFS